MHSRTLTGLVLAVAMIAAVAAHAEGFDQIVLSSTEGAKTSEAVFATDTPEIHLSAHITDAVPSGSKLVVGWVAIDSGGAAPANYRIAETPFDVGMIDNHIDASISRPTSGWPAGTYEVQLVVDGTLMETVPFSVK